jgi:methanogenic corrinoid protein MtbC1
VTGRVAGPDAAARGDGQPSVVHDLPAAVHTTGLPDVVAGRMLLAQDRDALDQERAMSVLLPPRASDSFLELALAGERAHATRFSLDLLDQGFPLSVLLTDLLGVVQREVGARWHRAELGVADEHVVTGVSQATLGALAAAAPHRRARGSVVLACAEGDWHSLPAQLFAEALRAEGQGVITVGPSSPAEAVARLIEHRRPDALLITCNLALSYPGVASLADAAHRHGTPVLAGGRALDPARAVALGADAWAADAPTAVNLLRSWRQIPPEVDPRPVDLAPAGAVLEARAPELGGRAYEALAERFPPMLDYDRRQLAHTNADLVYIVRFLGAARLVDDDGVFAEFVAWLEELLASRGVPVAALISGLEVLAPLVRDVDERSGAVMSAAARSIADRAA